MESSDSDIRKTGYLKKLKTMKKKFFVLRDDSPKSHACLEYYDSEKKFKNGALPKRSITIKTCFNINKKSDTKHKFAISLYTKEDCFSVLCDSEEEQEAWLTAMLELQTGQSTDGETPKPLFEHIWQVNVKPRLLGNSRNLVPGPYRLCLTNKTLSLIRKNQDSADIVFQLPSIRRCGHSECFFLMEVGRSAVTGAGELWMQVEDTVIAQNMHEAILSSMRSVNSAADQPNLRPRSRSRTISEGQSGSPNRSFVSPKRPVGSRHSTVAEYTKGHSPSPGATSPLSQSMAEQQQGPRLRSDSMESRGSRGTGSSISVDELDISPMEVSSGPLSQSVTPEGTMKDEGLYLPMTPSPAQDILISSPSPQMPPSTGYMEMSPGVSVSPPGSDSTREGYIDMSPGTPVDSYMDMTPTSYSTSPASSQDIEDRPYLDMTPMARSLPTVQERLTSEGYLDMSPGRHSPSSSSYLRPEKVHSYLTDDGSLDDFPKRAYSVGSKSNVMKPKLLSHAYMDMDSKNLEKANSKSSSAPHLIGKEKESKKRQESKVGGSSTELTKSHSMRVKRKVEAQDHFMVLDFIRPRTNSENQGHRTRTGSGGQESRPAGFRQRTGSAGQESRPRTSSFGKEVRPSASKLAQPAPESDKRASTTKEEGRRRASSFGKEGIPRTSSVGQDPRPRTATISQDSIRPRTSSFNSDMRPRSSSHGSGRMRRGFRENGVSSSSESLKRSSSSLTNTKGSQESVKSNLSIDYLDMTPKVSMSPSQALISGQKVQKSASNSKVNQEENKVETPLDTKADIKNGYMCMSPVGSEAVGLSTSKDAAMNQSSGHSATTVLQVSSHSTTSGSYAMVDRVGSHSTPTTDYAFMDLSKGPGAVSSQASLSEAQVNVQSASNRSLGVAAPGTGQHEHGDLGHTKDNMMKASEDKKHNTTRVTSGNKSSQTSATPVPDKHCNKDSKDDTEGAGEYVDLDFRKDTQTDFRKDMQTDFKKETETGRIGSSGKQNTVFQSKDNARVASDRVSSQSQQAFVSVTNPSDKIALSDQSESTVLKADQSDYMEVDASGKSETGTDDYCIMGDKSKVQSAAVGQPLQLQKVVSPIRMTESCKGNKTTSSDRGQEKNPVSKKVKSESGAKTVYSLLAKLADTKSQGRTKEATEVVGSQPTEFASGSSSKLAGQGALSGLGSYPGPVSGPSQKDTSMGNGNTKHRPSSPRSVMKAPLPPQPKLNTTTSKSSEHITSSITIHPSKANVLASSSVIRPLSNLKLSDSPVKVTPETRNRAHSGGIEKTSVLTGCFTTNADASQAKLPPRVRSSGSLSCTVESSPGLRRSLHEATSSDENLAFGRCSRQSSHGSVGSEKELNYASLDLSSSTDEGIMMNLDKTPRSPALMKSRHSSNEDNEAPLSYAQIDFAKCEDLKKEKGSSGLKENRFSFELK